MAIGNKVHVGDVGTTLAFYIGVDCTAYSTLSIRYVKPDATTGTWSAAVSGTDPKTIVYVTAEDDIDQDGTWEFQAHVENVTGTTKLTGERVTETVYPTIEVEA